MTLIKPKYGNIMGKEVLAESRWLGLYKVHENCFDFCFTLTKQVLTN